MIKSLTISQLAERCQAESRRYQQSEQSDQRYCFELFRRALVEQNEPAWQAIHTQYQPLVAAWVRYYSRFPDTGEEADFFVNDAFARLWRSGSKPETAAKLDGLGKCLKFLKACVGSAIEDYLRKTKKDALKEAISLEKYRGVNPGDENVEERIPPIESMALSNPGVEAQVVHILSLKQLKQALWETIQDEQERLVAEESWVYAFAPRQIQERYPDTFATAKEVSQIKKNLRKRLRRRLKEKIKE
jgi:hypothetical protein